MRKIEQQMVSAIAQKRNWQSGNTQVTTVKLSCGGARSEIYLHGNHIANVWTGAADPLPTLWVNRDTLATWPTPTTKSRLRALGADVYTKNHTTYLDEVAVNSGDSYGDSYGDPGSEWYAERDQFDEEYPADTASDEADEVSA